MPKSKLAWSITVELGLSHITNINNEHEVYSMDAPTVMNQNNLSYLYYITITMKTYIHMEHKHNKYIMVKHCMIDLHCFVYPLYKWVPTSINTLPKANVSSNVSYHCPRISQLYYNQILVYNPSRVFTRFVLLSIMFTAATAQENLVYPIPAQVE